jgi:hypothetical protein
LWRRLNFFFRSGFASRPVAVALCFFAVTRQILLAPARNAGVGFGLLAVFLFS